MNSNSSHITLLRATEWKQDSVNSRFRIVLAYTGEGFSPLATWEEWQHNDKEASFGTGEYFRLKEVDHAHASFQRRKTRFRLTEQVPPQRGAVTIGAESLEVVIARAQREVNSQVAPPHVAISRDLKRGGLVRFSDELAGDLTDEFSKED